MSEADWAAVRVVSWDLDGTLYAMPALRRALRRRLLGAVLRLRWLAVWQAMAALVAHQRLTKRLRRTGARTTPRPALWDSPRYQRFLSDWLVPAIGDAGPRLEVVSLIAAIAASGRAQIVISDFRAAEKLEVLGLADHFAAHVAGEDVGWIKPAPELFHHALRERDVAPHELLHIGDRHDTDGVAARASGVPFVHVDEGLAALAALVTQGSVGQSVTSSPAERP